MKTEDIGYNDGAVNCSGFLVYDPAVSGKRPGVLVVHEAWGLSDHAMQRSRMLADLGYVAFAADMFGDRRVATSTEQALELRGDLASDATKLRGRAKAALNVLAARPEVDPKRLGAIGFCFGGTTVLELARSGEDLAAVVSFHGSLDRRLPETSDAIRASVLVCTGADDPLVPGDRVLAFEDEMRKANADYQVISYGGTLQSFTNPAADGSFNPALLYNERSDHRSWAAMCRLFDEKFDS